MAMNCTTFRAAISAAVDSRKLPAPHTAAHLDECSDVVCRAAWDDAHLLDRAIAGWRTTRPEIDVAAAVVSAWRTAQRDAVRPSAVDFGRGMGSATRSRPAATSAVAVIAAVAIALLAIGVWSPGPGRPIASRRPASLAAHNPAGEPELACVTYAQNAAQMVTDAVVLTLGGGEQLEDPQVSPIGIGWEADWPPLGEVHAALDDLLESLPANPPPS